MGKISAVTSNLFEICQTLIMTHAYAHTQAHTMHTLTLSYSHSGKSVIISCLNFKHEIYENCDFILGICKAS